VAACASELATACSSLSSSSTRFCAVMSRPLTDIQTVRPFAATSEISKSRNG
jgi:hypothetical protein